MNWRGDIETKKYHADPFADTVLPALQLQCRFAAHGGGVASRRAQRAYPLSYGGK